jgi:hypothetical protein
MAVRTYASARYLLPAMVLLASWTFLSSLAFILTVNRPVFDDPNNLPDVHRYATEGVSIQTIYRQINPTGPTSFIWMGEAARIFGGSELEMARVAALTSWVLLCLGVLFCTRSASSSPDLWYAGLLVTLVFPHALTASATVLTEGPALLFAMVGALLWVESCSTTMMNLESMVRCAIGGLLLGLSITCRQYYVAILPTMFIVALFQFYRRRTEVRPRWFIAIALSVLLATVPLGFLVFIWKGMSSPGMVTGNSYNNAWRSTVAVNLNRPLVAAFYILLYLFPLTFPAIRTLSRIQRALAGLFALLSAALLLPLRDAILQPGPLQSVLHGVRRLQGAEPIAFGAVTALIIFNAVAVACVVRKRRLIIWSEAPVLFAICIILFFVLEQSGIGGNIPFYDRYVLQLAPFLGIFGFAFLRPIRVEQVGALAGLYLLNEAMLWRYAI